MLILVTRITRDAILLLAIYALWIAGHHTTASAFAVPTAIAAGVMITVAAFLVHEWGHLFGAWLSGSAVQILRNPLSVFLFNFDENRNSRKQFVAMSCGGFVASVIVVLLLFMTLSFHALADQVAWGLTAIGIVATFVLEIPPAWRAFKAM